MRSGNRVGVEASGRRVEAAGSRGGDGMGNTGRASNGGGRGLGRQAEGRDEHSRHCNVFLYVSSWDRRMVLEESGGGRVRSAKAEHG